MRVGMNLPGPFWVSGHVGRTAAQRAAARRTQRRRAQAIGRWAGAHRRVSLPLLAAWVALAVGIMFAGAAGVVIGIVLLALPLMLVLKAR